MKKKERHFSKSQEWLDWLSDNSPDKTVNPDTRQYSSRIASRTSQVRPASSSRVAASGRTLGLRPDMFTARPVKPAAAPSKWSKADKRPSGTPRPRPVLHVAGQTDDSSIAIRIDLPKLHLPSLHVPWKRVFKWGSVSLVVAMVIIGTPTLIRNQTEEQKKKTAAAVSSTPAYAPLKPESQVSGAQYDSTKKLYKYDSTYKGLTITVSQQPLPEKLREDPSKVRELAETLGTVESFETTNGTAYIASGEQSNTQRVVVVHRQLLLFLQSNGTLSSVDWVKYVQNLD